jgi:hypothetical protein
LRPDGILPGICGFPFRWMSIQVLATSFRGATLWMDLSLTLFALAAFAGGFVSGFSGLAMGPVVSGTWLHIITPVQTATLIAGYGLITQGYGILKLRQTFLRNAGKHIATLPKFSRRSVDRARPLASAPYLGDCCPRCRRRE